MKVAFVFSGLIRELEKTSLRFLELINKSKADVYASFWDIENPEDGSTISNFTEIFKPKYLEIESWKAWESSTWNIIQEEYQVTTDLIPYERNKALSPSPFSMWYKIWRANMLTKFDSKPYDVVVRLRTDLILSPQFEIQQNDYLNIPHGEVGIWNWQHCYGMHDFIAYGKPEHMDYYSSIFYYLSRYHKEGHYIYPPENILRHHLSQKEIPIRFYGDTVLLRDGGNSDRNNPNKPEEIFLSSYWANKNPDPELSYYKSRI